MCWTDNDGECISCPYSLKQTAWIVAHTDLLIEGFWSEEQHWDPPGESSLVSSIALWLYSLIHICSGLTTGHQPVFKKKQEWHTEHLNSCYPATRCSQSEANLYFSSASSVCECESAMFPEGISFLWQLCLLPTSHFLVNPDAVVNLRASFAEVSMEVNEKWMEGKATV